MGFREKEELKMRFVKGILKTLSVIVLALLIGYLVYTFRDAI